MRAISLCLLLLFVGCATQMPFKMQSSIATDSALQQKMKQTFLESFPREKRLTHRMLLNAGGYQFSCDGLILISVQGGFQLAMLSPMGSIAELDVQPDGKTRILKIASSFRESWAREYVVTTAQWLFAPDILSLQFGRLVDGRPVLWKKLKNGSRWLYVFNNDGSQWQEAEVVKGRCVLWRATGSPEHLHVVGDSFELELRTMD